LSGVLIDLQDVGARWYTYLYTMQQMLKACRAVGLPVVVLDRPNPQGGVAFEGMLAEADYFSIVAPGALPVRYGLTFGEAALWFNRSVGADLRVQPLKGWRRDMLFATTGLMWAAPSPGMPHAETALLYSGTCLIEGLNVSEGRGTALPFTQIGAPFIKAEALSDTLNALNLPGIRFTPAWFRPSSSKHAQQACEGVRLHITDAYALRGFALGVHLVATLLRLYGDHIAFGSYQGRLTFDTLCGGPRLRTALQRQQPAEEIIAWCEEEAVAFQRDVRDLFLYG
jgi:uncharacterized protein YbbC (DUF1343 family)